MLLIHTHTLKTKLTAHRCSVNLYLLFESHVSRERVAFNLAAVKSTQADYAMKTEQGAIKDLLR